MFLDPVLFKRGLRQQLEVSMTSAVRGKRSHDELTEDVHPGGIVEAENAFL